MPITTITEGKLDFAFDEQFWWTVVYDKHLCHTRINTGTEAKGLDFVSLYKNETVILSEIKDYSNVPPLAVAIPSPADPKKSLAVVIPKKVRDSIAGIVAYHKSNTDADALQWQKLSQNISSPTKKVVVIVWVETDTPQKKAQMTPIFNKIKEKMKWLKADILLVSLENYKNMGLQGFEVVKAV